MHRFKHNSTVTLIDTMGDDLRVVNAARVSFDKFKELYDGNDAKLIKYLASHNHWTPFGHIMATFFVEAPIFVARQLGKHQVGFVWNEVSRRYVDTPPMFYVPEKFRERAKNKKQGSGPGYIDPEQAEGDLRLMWMYNADAALDLYQTLLHTGVAPEQARAVLPQHMFTSWYWTGSIAAFSRVCKLRLDESTQEETRKVAEQISDRLKPHFPDSWKALNGTL